MNLVKFLLKEHSKATTAKIVKYVNGNPARFQELVDVYLKGPGQITQRAAWPLSYCVEHNPELIYPHLSKILKFLHKPENHDAVKRNTIRLLQYVNIPTRMQGNVATICFDSCCRANIFNDRTRQPRTSTTRSAKRTQRDSGVSNALRQCWLCFSCNKDSEKVKSLTLLSK